MADIDESILANLTEEERAALEAPDSDSEHQEVDLDQVAAQQQQQEEEQDADPDKKPDPEKDGKPEEQQQEEQQDQQEQQKAQQPEAPVPQPVFKPVATEELKAKYDDIDKREEELIEKFEEGELTTREYNAQLRELNKERGDLDWQQRKDELNRESVEQQIERQWQADVKAFAERHPEIYASEEDFKALDLLVQSITKAKAEQGLRYGEADLERAYRIWADERGIAPPKPANEEPKQEQAAQQQQKQPKQQQKALDIPPTLAKVPAAAPEDTDDGKFAALDRMADSDPQKYQETIARMSAEEYDAYTRR